MYLYWKYCFFSDGTMEEISSSTFHILSSYYFIIVKDQLIYMVIITAVIKLISRERIVPLPYKLHIIVKIVYWHYYTLSWVKITILYFPHLSYVALCMPYIYKCLQLSLPTDIKRLHCLLIQVKIIKLSI